MDRDWLAGTLWPESGQTQALAGLRQSLSDLRSAMGDDSWRLVSAQHTLRLDLDGMDADVTEFDRCIQENSPASLDRAVTLYSGPLLQDCDEEWVFLERERRAQSYLSALETLASFELEAGETNRALSRLRVAAANSPYSESVHRALMKSLAASGDYGAVTLVYRELRLRLRQELNTAPATETSALFEELRARAKQGLPNTVSASPTSPGRQPSLTEESLLIPERRIPRPLTGLIGRAKEADAVIRALYASRLVTLTGTGGVGKTRLSIHVAEQAAADYPDGVYFVDLATVPSGSLASQTIASALDIREEGSRELVNTLIHALRSSRLLLLLDNCEHLIEEVTGLVARLLSECPHLRVLATSRQPLGITGEVTLRVPSLSLPRADLTTESDLSDILDPEILIQYEAINLFVERAKAALSSFKLTRSNASFVLEICRRLDGIPLALELAAARIRVLSVEQIAERLTDQFKLLTRGSRSALPRQQTLKALIDWSYNLLPADEKRLMGRLSVFAGSWSLEAAETICSGNGIEPEDIVEILTELVDKSLVMVIDDRQGRKYGYLETIRAYARDEAITEDELAAWRHRHLLYFLNVGEQADQKLREANQAVWLAQLATAHDDLRAALDYANATAGLEALQLRLAAALWRFWTTRGYLREGEERLANALARTNPDEMRDVRARALNGAAALAWHQGRLNLARDYINEGLVIDREIGEPMGLSQSLHNLGNLSLSQADYQAARTLYEESLVLRRKLGNPQLIAATLNNLGIIEHAEGNFQPARARHEEALVIARELNDLSGIDSSLIGLGNVARDENDLLSAKNYFKEALAIACETGSKDTIAGCLNNIALISYQEGNYVLARTLCCQGLTISVEMNDLRGIADGLEHVAKLDLAEQEPSRAARLWGAIEALREEINWPRSPIDKPIYEQNLQALRDAINPEVLSEEWSHGRGMSPRDIVEYAVGKGK